MDRNAYGQYKQHNTSRFSDLMLSSFYCIDYITISVTPRIRLLACYRIWVQIRENIQIYAN